MAQDGQACKDDALALYKRMGTRIDRAALEALP